MKNLSFVFVASLIACGCALADGGGTADLLNQTKTPEFIQKPAGNVKISTVCTDDYGKQYNKEDTGYLRCMENYKAKSTAPGSPPNPNSKPAAGFGFKVGD